jgi:CheY-like chemotaxis protein
METSLAGQAESVAEGPARAAVLIVDDSAVDRRIAGAIVERVSGLRCEYAEDGEQALAAIARERPCAVLTDLQMAGMDGLVLVKEVRRLYPAVPVILMTAHGSEEAAMQALRAGAANYVPKRSLTRELFPTLRQILSVTSTVRHRERLAGAVRSRSASWAIENDPELIGPLVELIQEDLVTMQLGDETSRMRVGVAVQEALSNALFHGNLELSSDLRQEDERVFYDEAQRRRGLEPYKSRLVDVEARLDRRAATYVIRDAGPGFDTSRLDKPVDPEDLLRVGGRGLLLIRAFMDEVSYNAAGNEITLRKHAAGPND